MARFYESVTELPGEHEAKIDLQECPVGIYTYLLKSSGTFASGKLVKLL
jgi:hypothetical protein